jgi:flagellar hook-length control protein FliK
MGGREALTSAMKARPLELTGHVTTGAMAKSRLSSESLMSMTSSIRTIAGNGVNPTAGEMRIRLNPDHLGELSLKVRTRGKEVGLQIRASNEEAKRVLEESLGHLRENLATNALNLARVEVVLDRGGADAGGLGNQGAQQSQYPQSQQGSAQADLGSMGNWGGNAAGSFGQSGFGRDSERSSREESGGGVGLSRPRLGGLGPVMNLRSGRASESGRVDVMA